MQQIKMTEAVDITDGKGFISNNGLDWENVEDTVSSNLCIKAYANNVMEVFDTDTGDSVEYQ